MTKRTFSNLTVTLSDDDDNCTEFNVFDLDEKQALAHYRKVEKHYGKSQVLPTCPLCLCTIPLSTVQDHVLTCATYRSHLLAMQSGAIQKKIKTGFN